MSGLMWAGCATCVYTALVMWASQPSYACVLSEQQPRRLYLDRQVHREHLAQDAQRIQQLARRHATYAENIVRETEPQCLDELTRQLATAHQVSIDEVRRLIRSPSGP